MQRQQKIRIKLYEIREPYANTSGNNEILFEKYISAQ